MAEQFKHMSVNDFDQYDCVKLSKLFYGVLAVTLRAYLVWVMSVSNMGNSTGVIELIYPEPRMFYLSLASGTFGLFALLLISLRRPNASPWVKNFWPHTRTLLIVALLFDIAISLSGYFYWQLISGQYLVILIALNSLLIVWCLLNKRITLNLSEFPEPLTDK